MLHTPTNGMQEAVEFKPPGRPRLQSAVVVMDRRMERPPLDESHRIERPIVRASASQLIDRDDPGMLELAGDFRLLDEPLSDEGTRIPSIGPQLFEGHLATHMNVVRQPYLADTTLSMKLCEPVTLELGRQTWTSRTAR